MKFAGQRFLVLYSGALTALVVAALLCGFVRTPSKLTLQELDVQRINLREPDGTLRLVISDAAKTPGIYIEGKEYPHPSRRTAGMVFLNDEGTENGGLSFGGEKTREGKFSSGHLSFDDYEQDQTLVLESEQAGNQHVSKMEIRDVPDYPITDLLGAFAANKQLPPDQLQEKVKAFFAERGQPKSRMLIERGGNDGKGGHDDSVMFALSDAQGHPRIVMRVETDGTPSLKMLDEHGKVVGELVPKAPQP